MPSIKEYTNKLKSLQQQRSDFYFEKIKLPSLNLKDKLTEQYRPDLDKMDLEIKAAEKELIAYEKQIRSKKELPEELLTWVETTYQRGVSFGYSGLKLAYVDPQNRFVIVTIKGSTAGSGTAMGASGLYYSPTSHVVAFPQFGSFLSKPKVDSDKFLYSGNALFERKGRLTNSLKAEMIKDAEDFVKTYNVKPFDLNQINKR